MNMTQMHERLREELVRRIQRGTLSVSLLARQTGFGQSHLSNFLRSKRQLSLEAMDRILAAQRLTVADLLPAVHQATLWPMGEDESAIPVVSHYAALFEPMIRPSAAQSVLHLPAAALQSLNARAASARRAWQRFVAVRVPSGDAAPMDPLLLPNAIALIDRHYNSLMDYRPGKANLYAVRDGSHLTMRYVEFRSSRLILRPYNITYPIELIDVDPDEPPNELLVGRVALILNEL
jgi:transcriptional regulator with XRE-family HTH domain